MLGCGVLILVTLRTTFSKMVFHSISTSHSGNSPYLGKKIAPGGGAEQKGNPMDHGKSVTQFYHVTLAGTSTSPQFHVDLSRFWLYPLAHWRGWLRVDRADFTLVYDGKRVKVSEVWLS